MEQVVRHIVEICVDDAAGLDAAIGGGADRVELCSALALGGLTPSAALVRRAVASGCAVHAMVRPRPGDFCYDDDEVSLMEEEIRAMVSAGVDGVVVGATLADGMPDRDVLARWRRAAGGVKAVLHRAIDLAPDMLAATEMAIALGYDGILSSGGAPTAPAGAARLRDMVRVAAGRVQIVAGSGVNADTVGALIAASGVEAVHGSASRGAPSRDPRILALGFATGERRRTDPRRVASLVDAAQTAWLHQHDPAGE